MSKFSLRTTCPACKKTYVPELLVIDPKQFLPAWVKWQNGMVIQNAFPASQAYQREQLQTGICGDTCWDKYLEVANEVEQGKQ